MKGLARFFAANRRPPRRREAHRSRTALGLERLEGRELPAVGNAPTDLAQYMLELINRTRANPAAEGQRLLNLAATDPLIHRATANWNLGAFYQAISSYAPEPPLAFNPRLNDAAVNESVAMLVANAQRHSPAGYLVNPAVALDADGQPYLPIGNQSWATGENIYAYSQGVIPASPTSYADYFEASFLLDWGNPDFGHLKNILAPGPSGANPAAGIYPSSEVGIGLLTNAYPSTPSTIGWNVGPAIVTQEFGWRQGVSFLTGTVFLDLQDSGFYAPGEGFGGVTIRASGTAGQGTFQTQTWTTGGYSLQLPPGTYLVTASGPLPGAQASWVSIGSDNVGWSLGFRPNQASDIPVPADYDGVGHAEVAAFNPASGTWLIDNPTSGLHLVQFGGPGGVPVPGHYDGGLAEVAVYQPSTSTWYVFGPNGAYSVQFGGPGDVPVPGDYDGDGRTDFAVYRPSTATWYIRRSGSQSLQVSQWGAPFLDEPVPADYDGDGRTEIAVLRPTSYQWFILGTAGVRSYQFGGPGDVPVPGDYDGVGRAEVAVYQPASGAWRILDSGRGVPFGIPSADAPAPADYDGDGRFDPAVFRTSTAEWFALGSRGGIGYDQVGQGGTSLTLFGMIRAASPAVPWFWTNLIAAPGAARDAGGGGPDAADAASAPVDSAEGAGVVPEAAPAWASPSITIAPSRRVDSRGRPSGRGLDRPQRGRPAVAGPA